MSVEVVLGKEWENFPKGTKLEISSPNVDQESIIVKVAGEKEGFYKPAPKEVASALRELEENVMLWVEKKVGDIGIIEIFFDGNVDDKHQPY